MITRYVRWRTVGWDREEENVHLVLSTDSNLFKFLKGMRSDSDVFRVRVPSKNSMVLNFSNPSRSFDATKNRVEFWGYDNVIEVSFFVETAALKKLCPEMVELESGILKAFDDSRKRIQEVAEQVHARGRKGSWAHVLAAQNF